MTTIQGFDTACEQVRLFAHEQDTWMTPTEDADEKDSRSDFGNWLQEEQEGWEQTVHFQVKYGQRISDLAYDMADENDLDSEGRIEIYQDLKDEFWEEWADVHNAFDHWQKNIEEKVKKLKVGQTVDIGCWRYRRIAKNQVKRHSGQLYELESNLVNIRPITPDNVRYATYVVIRESCIG